MTIRETEQKIVAQIQDAVPDIKVEAFPNQPENYSLTSARGAILVSYLRSTFTAPSQGNVVVGKRRWEWSIIILIRNLRTHSGAYAILDAIRDKLTGFEVAAGSRMYPVQESFTGRSKGLWQYSMVMAHDETYTQV